MSGFTLSIVLVRFTHFFTWSCSLFVVLCSIPLCKDTLIIYSTSHGHLRCFQYLAITHNTAIIVLVHGFSEQIYTKKCTLGTFLEWSLPSLCIYMIVIGFSKYHQLSKVITMLHIAFKNALLFFFFFFNPFIYFWQHWVFIAACRISVGATLVWMSGFSLR